jgi:para-aminobenzoate synthetase/4-amino-4-deoxychorismate lyase
MLLISDVPKPALQYGERPDPGLGIYETMLVRDGDLPGLRLHLDRIRTSARELYGIEPGDDLPGLLLERASGHSGRLRVTLARDGTTTVETGPLGPDPEPKLAPYLLPGGLGRHKWADRRLLDALAEDAQGALPLLLDADGSVLETARTNVLIEEDGRLIGPPTDGRALPGIGRRSLTYWEEPIDLGRLLAADSVILTSALRVVRLQVPAAL